MRINKYLAEAGIASRRKCDEMIKNGLVKVNGNIAMPGDDVTAEDLVVCDGKPVGKPDSFEYYMTNKPKGYVCTVSDEKGRKTVMDLLPPLQKKRIYPIGRLDYDSEGLLLLTNDGELTYKLTHPVNQITKTYSVKTAGYVDDKSLNALRNGAYVDGRKLNKCRIEIIERHKDFSRFYVTVTEGRNREIRKMFETVHAEVTFLKRIKIGELKLSGLNRGEVRKLRPAEIAYLKSL